MAIETKPKTMLFVMPRLPFPPTTGRKTSLYHYCRILSEKLGYRLIVAAFLENGDDASNNPDFIDKLIILKKSSTTIKIIQLLFQSVIFRRLPMQVSLYWSQMAKRQIDLIIEEENPEIVIADMIRCTEYIKDCKCFKIADLDDRISLRYRRQLESDMANINPYGQYISNSSKLLRSILLWNPLKKWVTNNEIKLLEKYENETGKKFDATVFVAQKECDKLNNDLGKQVAYAVPNGVDINYFTRLEPLPDNHTIGFLGAMDVAHNEQAVMHFVNDILPIIKDRVPDAKFLVIGGGGSDRLKELESDSVRFTGRVNDVRDSLKQCRVFVCPMTFGSGIKTKLLEAMAYGIPVVTSSIGAENIDAKHRRDWIVEDENTAFADGVVSLLTDYKTAKTMGENGRIFVLDRFSWSAAESAFKNILRRIVN